MFPPEEPEAEKETSCGLIDAGTVNVCDPLTLAVKLELLLPLSTESESLTLPEPPPALTLTLAVENGKAGEVASKS